MTQRWIYGIVDIKDASHITSIIQSHLFMQRKIKLIIQACSTKALISNHTEHTPEYGKHITHWPKGSTCSDTTKCGTLIKKKKLLKKHEFKCESKIF